MGVKPQFIEPSAPDPLPIMEVHRNNDGFVAFQRKNSLGQFENVLSIRASEVSEHFPEFIAPHVDEESYFSINSMFLSPSRQRVRSKIDERFPMAQRGTSMLRHLTSCYIDLDCYKLNITVGQCIGAVIDAQDRGAFPPASIITRSGRGVWLFWLLRADDDPSAPVRAWPEKISTHRRIERQILRVFGTLGADAAAIDPARITRVPGSVHRETGKRVDYWLQADKNGQTFTYRLDELAVAFGVAPTRYPLGITKAINPKYAERGRKGYEALHRGRLSKLMTLIARRGIIEEGSRNHTALLLAVCQHRCKILDAELFENVEKFGRLQCRPALSEEEIRDAIRKRKQYRFDDYTVGDWLKITPEESELVGWPAAGTRPAKADTELRTRGQRTTARRELVRACVEGSAGATMPTVAELVGHIEHYMGSRPSSRTIMKDLDALGIHNPRARRKSDDANQIALID
jgi:hypothetical protein